MVNRIPFAERRLCCAVILGVAATVCACSDGGPGDGLMGRCGPGFDADRRSFVDDGGCCEFSVNCRAGSVCNTPNEPEGFFFPDRDQNICIRVTCSSNADCGSGQECSPENLCRPSVCQRAGDCPTGQSCLGGRCGTPPAASAVDRCEIVTRATALKEGQQIALTAVARGVSRAPLPGIAFAWSSSDPAVVEVSDATATGGSRAGAAMLSARPVGRTDVECSDPVSLVNLVDVPNGRTRVIVLADSDGSPVDTASVAMDIGTSPILTATTNVEGAAVFTTSAPIRSVTVFKEGWRIVSVLSPDTNDVLVPLPRIPDVRVAGGFKGVVDLSATENQQIKLGFVAPAIPENLLDLSLTRLLGDLLPTVINAPALGVNNVEAPLPGGLVLGLGNRSFTVNDTRCTGITPGANQLGCFVARAPAGRTAAWGFGGRLPLTAVTGIVQQLSDLLGGGGRVPIGNLLAGVLPLVRNLNHAVNPALDVRELPLAGGQPDFARFPRVDLAVEAQPSILSTVTVPDLPFRTGTSTGASCAVTGAGALVVSGALLEGRGLVPLGLVAGLDRLDGSSTPDCKVEGVEEPFGPRSNPLEDGQVPLAMAPLHSGMEGSPLFLLTVALDWDRLTGGSLQFAALVRRVDAVGPAEAFAGVYPDPPEGIVSRSEATVQLGSRFFGQTMVRAELRSGAQTWVVYAPAERTILNLPNVAQGRAVLAVLQEGSVMSIGTTGSYRQVWEFGSGRTLDRLVDTLTAFAIQDCTATVGADCEIRN